MVIHFYYITCDIEIVYLIVTAVIFSAIKFSRGQDSTYVLIIFDPAQLRMKFFETHVFPLLCMDMYGLHI